MTLDPSSAAAADYAAHYADRVARHDPEAAVYLRVVASDLRAGMHLNAEPEQEQAA